MVKTFVHSFDVRQDPAGSWSGQSGTIILQSLLLSLPDIGAGLRKTDVGQHAVGELARHFC
jgi:hypothetical protein